MSRFVLTALVFLLVVNFSAGSLFGSDVITLHHDNFADSLTEHDLLLVMFYSPRCGYSRLLLPNFDSAASILHGEDSPIKLGKVDCSEEINLRKTYHIRKYPTLKFFRRGTPLEYSGATIKTYDLSPADIVAWVKDNAADYLPPPAHDENGDHKNGDL